ncbi:MAG: zinc-binding dehydrogenase [Anaerolineales bacterium]|nr:zinc-binding dehydrogenase [Anaerolineales bacterium]
MTNKGLMDAIVYLAPQKLEFQRLEVPMIKEGDILVRVGHALTCGTDVKTYRRGHPKIPPPILFGHEFAGEIVSVGSFVENFEPGMRVVAANSAPCNTCYYCKQGQHNLCEDLILNFGAFAEYIRVPESIVQQNTFTVPDHITDEEAAATEPLGCVIHGQDLLKIQPGESVVIVGAGGPIGLMHLQLALYHGANPVIAADLSDYRLEIAAQLGATCAVNTQREDLQAVVYDLTAGRGADVVIESAGSLNAWQSAFELVRKGGRLQWFGGLPRGTEINLDTERLHYDELTIIGAFHATPGTFQRAFQMIKEGLIDIKPLITGRLPLEKLEEALQMMYNGECVKMAIVP